jgi:hypothetical protein
VDRAPQLLRGLTSGYRSIAMHQTAYARRRTTDGWTAAPVRVLGMASVTGLAAIPGGGMWAVGTSGDETVMRPYIARTER